VSHGHGRPLRLGPASLGTFSMILCLRRRMSQGHVPGTARAGFSPVPGTQHQVPGTRYAPYTGLGLSLSQSRSCFGTGLGLLRG